MEQAYPNREQLEAGIELAEAIGPGRTTRFRQMLNMHDAIAKRDDLIRRMIAEFAPYTHFGLISEANELMGVK